MIKEYRMKHLKKLGMGLLLGTCLLMAGQTSAMAQDINDYRESIRDYQTRMDKLKLTVTSRYNSEMESISEWIEQSLILIGKNELNKVNSLVVKTGVYLDYVEASVAKDAARGEAMTAETELKARKAEYGKLEAEVQQLEAEAELLTKQLDAMKK